MITQIKCRKHGEYHTYSSPLLIREDTGQRYPVPPGGLTIGRGEFNDIVLPDCPSVAPQQTRIFRSCKDGLFYIIDMPEVIYPTNLSGMPLESYVNVPEQAVTKFPLINGDIVDVGGVCFMWRWISPEYQAIGRRAFIER